MATNPNVLVDREKFIGGSEISTILGINSFKTRWELLQEKAQYVENEFNGNVYTEYGDYMEPLIRDYINSLKITSEPFIEDTIAIEEPGIGRRCNYDGKCKTHGLEIKTTSRIHESVREYKYYVVQLLWGMILGNLKKGILAVYHRPDDFDKTFYPERLQIFEIDIKDYSEWIDEINLGVELFKRDLEDIKRNPFLSEEDLLPERIKNLAIEVDEFEAELKELKEIEARYKDLKSKLADAMQEYNIKKWVTPGSVQITLVKEEDKEVEVVSYDEIQFIKENVKLYEEYHNKLEEYKEVKKEIKKGKSAFVKITLPK